MDERSDTRPTPSKRSLVRELVAVYAIQLILVIALVRLDALVSLAGNLHGLVAVVFVLLPILVLDRRDRPYVRYGIGWGKPHVDALVALAAAVLIFPPIAIFSPWTWGLGPLDWFVGTGDVDWRFVLPPGYPGIAVSHLLVVALPEEVFYRGYVMGRLDDVFKGRVRVLGASVGVALPIQAALFAVGHFAVDFHPARLAVFFPALAFGWLKARRGTLGAPIVFHASSNIFMDLFRAGLGL